VWHLTFRSQPKGAFVEGLKSASWESFGFRLGGLLMGESTIVKHAFIFAFSKVTIL